MDPYCEHVLCRISSPSKMVLWVPGRFAHHYTVFIAFRQYIFCIRVHFLLYVLMYGIIPPRKCPGWECPSLLCLGGTTMTTAMREFLLCALILVVWVLATSTDLVSAQETVSLQSTQPGVWTKANNGWQIDAGNGVFVSIMSIMGKVTYKITRECLCTERSDRMVWNKGDFEASTLDCTGKPYTSIFPPPPLFELFLESRFPMPQAMLDWIEAMRRSVRT